MVTLPSLFTKKTTPDFHGKVAVITGGARGIGAALARQLSAAGASIALVGIEDETLAELVPQLPSPSKWWHVDVTDQDRLIEVAKEISQHFNSIDIVVANAGIASASTVTQSEPEKFNAIIDVNLTGSVNTARAFAPYLKLSRGYFLQISSVAAILRAPFMAAYCASKAGVEAFAQIFGLEMQYFGVTVGTAYTSWVKTDMVAHADKDEKMRKMRSSLPYPLNKTYEIPEVVNAFVQGIADRKYEVYGQKWIAAYNVVRWLATPVIRSQVRKYGNFELAADSAPESNVALKK